MSSILTVLIAVVASGGATAIINAYANRDKNRAQVHNMNIEGDLKVGENWKEYAAVLKKDMEGMKAELTLVHNKYLDLEKKYNDLNVEHIEVMREREEARVKIHDLESKVAASERRIKELQDELTKYKISNE